MQKYPKFNMTQLNGLLAELSSDASEARRLALCALMKYTSSEWGSSPEAVAAAVGPVIAVAGGTASSNQTLRGLAIQVLGNIGPHSPEVLPELSRLLQRGTEVELQAEAARALGKIGAPAEGAGEALIAALNRRDPGLRCAAAQALARVAPLVPAAVAALRAATGDANGSVAVCAASALWAATGDGRAILALAERLSDPEARDAAVQALYRIGPPAKAAVPALQSVRAGNDRLFREAVGMALGKITVPAMARSR